MAIGFKHGSFGGEVLGITVVPGTTKPSNPKENTIWANSSNPMGSWDISPTEPHRVSRTDNLIVYPYRINTYTNSGVTFTVGTSSSNKGKITVNGTNTSSGSIVCRLSNSGVGERELLLQPGTYYLSGNCSSSSSTTHRLLLAYTYDNWKTNSSVNELENDGRFTLTKVAKARVTIQVSGKVTVNNAVYQPMLTKGSKATSYVMGDASGQIWIKTDHMSDVLMDALKGKNGIVVQPRSVYEYTTDNGWAVRDAQVYQYGAWKDLKAADASWDGYYFKNGEQYTDVTGGWTKDGWGGTGSVTVGNALVATGTDGAAVVGTANPVDLSSVSKVWIDSPNGTGSYGTAGYMFIAKSKSTASSESVAYVQIKNAGSFSIDVSSLSGKYYIYLYAGSGAYVDARAIWME